MLKWPLKNGTGFQASRDEFRGTTRIVRCRSHFSTVKRRKDGNLRRSARPDKIRFPNLRPCSRGCKQAWTTKCGIRARFSSFRENISTPLAGPSRFLWDLAGFVAQIPPDPTGHADANLGFFSLISQAIPSTDQWPPAVRYSRRRSSSREKHTHSVVGVVRGRGRALRREPPIR